MLLVVVATILPLGWVTTSVVVLSGAPLTVVTVFVHVTTAVAASVTHGASVTSVTTVPFDCVVFLVSGMPDFGLSSSILVFGGPSFCTVTLVTVPLGWKVVSVTIVPFASTVSSTVVQTFGCFVMSHSLASVDTVFVTLLPLASVVTV
jgi:hypothetical protein